MRFGKALEYKLHQLDRTRSWLASKLGKSHTLVSKWVDGGQPVFDTAIDVMDILAEEDQVPVEQTFLWFRSRLKEDDSYWEEAFRLDVSLNHLLISIWGDNHFKMFHLRDDLYAVERDGEKYLCHFIENNWYYSRSQYNSFFDTWYETERKLLRAFNLQGEEKDV